MTHSHPHSNRIPRLRGLLGLLVAIAAVVALLPGAASAKAPVKEFDSSINMQAQPSGSGVGQAFLFGNVTSDKKACMNRTVYIYRQVPGDPNTWDYGWDAFEVTAADFGGFTRYLSKADEAYDYTAVAARKVIAKPSKKIVCNSAWMYDVVIPRR